MMMAHTFSQVVRPAAAASAGSSASRKPQNTVSLVWGGDKDKIKQYYLENAASPERETVTRINADMSWWRSA